MKTKIITKGFFNTISVTVLIVLIGICSSLLYAGLITELWLVTLLILSVILSSSIQIADQWEKAVVLRLGRYRGLNGPGIFGMGC